MKWHYIIYILIGLSFGSVSTIILGVITTEYLFDISIVGIDFGFYFILLHLFYMMTSLYIFKKTIDSL